MSTETTSGIKRRTVTKGALWAVPAVTAATQIPAFAASPLSCEALTEALGGFYVQGADWINWTRTVGNIKIPTQREKGSFFDTRLGTWQFNKTVADLQAADQRVTGYEINWNPNGALHTWGGGWSRPPAMRSMRSR